MAHLSSVRKRHAKSEMCFTAAVHDSSKPDSFCPILPGLPDDVAKLCLAFIPLKFLPAMASVNRRWTAFIQSKEFMAIRKETGLLEEWIYFLTCDSERKGIHWEAMNSLGSRRWILPPMPGPVKAGFGVIAFEGKLLIIGGFFDGGGMRSVFADVYQYNARLNRWSTLAELNVARYDFACTEVNGMIYAVGGYGADGVSLSSAEVYDPENNQWSLIESLRRPRYGCFAFSIDNKLYVMGGRSSFIIGNSKFVDVYSPELNSWREMKNRGCVMVTAHAVVGKQLFCMEWKNQKRVAVFEAEDNSWRSVALPFSGSSVNRFQFGVLDGKLLLFSMEDAEYQTLLYDPDAVAGSEWGRLLLKPSGLCLCTVTIQS